MTERVFPGTWKIVGSTSGLFPVRSGIHLSRIQPNESRFNVRVRRQGQPEETSFEAKLPDVTAPEEDTALEGQVPDGQGGKVQLVATFCPGEDKGPSFLCGHVTRPGQRIGDGATGVWVAEEDRPPTDPPPKKC
jgi:hypothetical protein